MQNLYKSVFVAFIKFILLYCQSQENIERQKRWLISIYEPIQKNVEKKFTKYLDYNTESSLTSR